MTQTLLNQCGIISPGGTVFAGALSHDGSPLVATPAGIFRREDGSWLPLSDQPAIPFPQAFIASDRYLLLGGAGAILFSADSGTTWKRGQTDALEQPVTCLMTAPNFADNRVALAGTDGAGILRSTDGGRIWQYASFGLQDFSILALATAPVWDDREIVFAATPSGMYRSTNGGRAWKSANGGLDGCTVLALVLSPTFADDGIVLAGTEAHGIYQSSDSGFSWQSCMQVEEPNGEFPAINALWHHPMRNFLLAGLHDGQIWCSVNAGETWTRCGVAQASVLCFLGDGHRIYAGTDDAGLLYSEDSGKSWHSDTALSARQFTRLLSSEAGELFALGAIEGLWQSGDGGRSWHNVGDFETLLLTTAVLDDQRRSRFAATIQGLLRADDSNPDWQLVLSLPDITTIFSPKTFAPDQRIWVGTWGGEYFASEDGGFSWQMFPSPSKDAPIVQIGMTSPEQLVSITFNPGSQMLTLWRLENGRWQIWLESPASSAIAQIAEVSSATDETVVSLGTRCWRWLSGRWNCILNTENPIFRLCWYSKGGLLVLTADQLAYSPDLANWNILNKSQGASFYDLALVPQTGQERVAYLLTRGGVLLQGLLSM